MSDHTDSNPLPRCVKVAVVGSGLAGLTAAYLLSTVHQRTDVRHNGRPVKYEVHIFEKVCARFPSPLSLDKVCSSFHCRDAPTPFSFSFALLIVRQCDCQANALGMDSHSVSLMLPGETGEWRVDVPMRSFQGGKYSSRWSKRCWLMIAQKVTTLSSSHSTVTSVCHSGVRISHIRFLSSTPSLPTAWASPRKKPENIRPFTQH